MRDILQGFDIKTEDGHINAVTAGYEDNTEESCSSFVDDSHAKHSAGSSEVLAVDRPSDEDTVSEGDRSASESRLDSHPTSNEDYRRQSPSPTVISPEGLLPNSLGAFQNEYTSFSNQLSSGDLVMNMGSKSLPYKSLFIVPLLNVSSGNS